MLGSGVDRGLLARGVRGGALWFLSSTIGSLGFAFLAAVQLGSSGLGTYAIATAIIGFVAMFCHLELEAQVRRISCEGTQLRLGAIVPTLALWGFVVGLLLAGAFMVAQTEYWIALTPAPVLLALAAPVGWLSARAAHAGDPTALVRISSLGIWARVIFLVICHLCDLTASPWQLVAIDALVLLAGAVGLRRHMPPDMSWSSRAPSGLVGEIAREWRALLAVSGSWKVIQRSDTILIGGLLGTGAAGVYQIFLRLGETLMSAYSAMLSGFLPFAARGSGRAREALYLILAVASPLALACYLPLVFQGGRLLPQILGAEFQADEGMAAILYLGMMFHVLNGPNGLLLVLSGDRRSMIGISVAAVATNLVANLALIPNHGLLGGAIGTTLGLVVLNIGYSTRGAAAVPGVGHIYLESWRRTLLLACPTTLVGLLSLNSEPLVAAAAVFVSAVAAACSSPAFRKGVQSLLDRRADGVGSAGSSLA